MNADFLSWDSKGGLNMEEWNSDPLLKGWMCIEVLGLQRLEIQLQVANNY